MAGAVIGQVVNTSEDAILRYQYFATDNLGSITEVADGAGSEIEAFSYDPFGTRRGAVNRRYARRHHREPGGQAIVWFDARRQGE